MYNAAHQRLLLGLYMTTLVKTMKYHYFHGIFDIAEKILSLESIIPDNVKLKTAIL